MASDLKGRLSRLRALSLDRASSLPAAPDRPRAPARTRDPGLPPAFLEGWEPEADLVWRRSLRFGVALPETIDAAPFLVRGSARRAADPLRPEPLSASSLRFFDLETSGLSGGTGTVAFLAAVGRAGPEGFEVRQLFLEDYPGEASFLGSLLAELGAGEGAVVVTYNGKAFDLPLLRTRCVMNGILPPAPRDLDALFCARRLWRRVHGGASLSLLEAGVLGIERAEDVPGSEIPEIWFQYLRRSDHPLMGAVMSHNAHDVASLAALVGRASRAFAEPRRLAASAGIDRAGLGRGLLAMDRPDEGEELLEAAAADGDEGAGLFLSRRYRRSGRDEDRRRVLSMLPETYDSCVERAKYHEHAAREYGEALGWAAKALALAAGQAEEAEAKARRDRLRRRLEG